MIELSLDDPDWIGFVLASSGATAFHHPSWANLLSRCYRYRGLALAVTDASGRIIAGLPLLDVKVPLRGRKWVSLPFTDHCPPLVDPGADVTQLTTTLMAMVKSEGLRRVEVRAALGNDADATTAGVIHRLRLDPDPAAVFAQFKRSQVQRNVRRAEKQGIVVERSQERSHLVDIFYRLHVRTRRRQGVPVQPRRYFELLWEAMIEQGLGYVSVAYAGTKPVASAVFLTWRGTVIYKYGASDQAAWPLRPNHLLFWDAIEASCRNGDHTFDFGRTELSNDGLRSFKGGWNAEETLLHYSIIGGADRSRSSVHRGAALVQPALRHAPLWACRAVGALLYRYAA